MKTEIIVITDRSGSMSGLTKDVIGGFNKFIADQKAVPGECKVTYTQFDSQYEVVYAGKNLQDVPDLSTETFVPRGSTALHDAIGLTLNEQGKRIKDEAWAELVIVQIITDGGENASKEYSSAQVKTMIEHAQANGWQILFLAANQDAFATSQNLGIYASNVANYSATAKGTMNAYEGTSSYASSLRSMGAGASVTLQVDLDS